MTSNGPISIGSPVYTMSDPNYCGIIGPVTRNLKLRDTSKNHWARAKVHPHELSLWKLAKLYIYLVMEHKPVTGQSELPSFQIFISEPHDIFGQRCSCGPPAIVQFEWSKPVIIGEIPKYWKLCLLIVGSQQQLSSSSSSIKARRGTINQKGDGCIRWPKLVLPGY